MLLTWYTTVHFMGPRSPRRFRGRRGGRVRARAGRQASADDGEASRVDEKGYADPAEGSGTTDQEAVKEFHVVAHHASPIIGHPHTSTDTFHVIIGLCNATTAARAPRYPAPGIRSFSEGNAIQHAADAQLFIFESSRVAAAHPLRRARLGGEDASPVRIFAGERCVGLV